MKSSLALLLALGAAACGSSTEPAPLPSSDIILELGQSRPLAGTPFTVSFQRLDEESRCAVGVVCVWEGNARIVLGLAQSAGPEVSAALNTNRSAGPVDVTFRHVRIELAELTPYPSTEGPAGPYRARLRWSYLPD